MKKKILFLLILSLIAIGNVAGQTADNPIKLGTWSETFARTIDFATATYPSHNVSYSFTITSTMDITISHCGSIASNTGIFIRDENENLMASDVGFGNQCSTPGLASVTAITLPPGTYSIYMDWDWNAKQISTEIAGKKASITKVARDIGEYSKPFYYTDTQNTRDPQVGYQGSEPFNNGVCYSFTITCSMDVIVSNCGSSVSDTQIYFMDEDEYRIGYNDDYSGADACLDTQQAYLVMPNLSPGTYYVVSKGVSYNGNITTRIQGVIAQNIPDITAYAKNIGEFSKYFNYTDTQNNGLSSVGYQGYGQFRYGICYSFSLLRSMDISISNCGSQVENTLLYLLDDTGEVIYENDDYSGVDACDNPKHAHLKVHLNPGIYYVVSTSGREQGLVSTQITGKSDELKIGSANKNYIITRNYTDESGNEWLDKLDYFDAMGRIEQTVLSETSPQNGDIITTHEYDAFGRMSSSWLPAEIKDNLGEYIELVDMSTKVVEANDNDESPYSVTHYDPSPLERPIQQYGPGEVWQARQKSVDTKYQLTNSTEYGTLYCNSYLLTDVVENGDTIMTLEKRGCYPKGSLHVTQTMDEDENSSFEFKDHFGQLVLRRQISRYESTHYDTYYIYDDWGNLRAVLPPIASDEMKKDWDLWNESDATIRKYVYLYKYDNRFRMTAKRLPGQEWIHYIYDKSSAPLFSQDGEQRKRNEWSFSISDGQGRICLMGVCKNDFNLSSTSLNAPVNAIRDTTGIYKGYTISGIVLADPQIMTVNYYDNYEFMGKNGFPSASDNNYRYEALSEFDKRYPKGSQSLLTGTLTAQLDGSEVINYLPAVMYYDYHGRLIQSKSGTHLAGGVEKEYTAYNFMNNPIKRQHTHILTGKSTQTEIYNYEYDHAERPLKTEYLLNGRVGRLTLADNEYDCIGRLKTNKRNGNINLKTSYSYNVRSWMRSISNPLFSQKLYYNDYRDNQSNDAYYNGNISAMDWSVSSDTIRRGYNFEYGKLSQLLSATYQENDTLNNKFGTSYSYDKQGNLLTLSRKGRTYSGEYGLLDNLRFTLNGNQLEAVNDYATDSVYNNGFEFNDNAKVATEYFYNANGNLIKDLNKNITDIQYNFLNLPYRITFQDGSTISYTYAADGTKLRTVHKIGSITTTTDYCGNVIYENGIAKLLITEAGYISLPDKKHHFYLQDHQGNNRIVADENGKVEETNHYYPFGGTFASENTDVQPYKYNGKELDTKAGLDWYDYGARHYDAALGRWHAADPMSEKYYEMSPYAYCANNPVKYIDPDGKSWRVKTYYNEDTKKIEYQISVNAVLYNNSSNKNINMNKLAASITQQINDVYTISGNNFASKMDFNMRVVNSVKEIGESDHVFRVVDQASLDYSHPTKDHGAVLADANTLGLDVRIGPEATENLINGSDKRTAAHELGHTGGLNDLSKTVREDRDRLMMQANNAYDLGVAPNKAIRLPHSDIQEIRDNYIHNKLNHNSPVKSWFGIKYLRR